MAFDRTQQRNRQYGSGVIRHGGMTRDPEPKANPDLPIEIYPPPNFYLAGPFFNPAQLAIIERIEVMMCDHGVPFISPRLTDKNKKAALDDTDAKEIFGNNILGMAACGAMLAVLDWVMPIGQELRVVQQEPGNTVSIPGKSKRIVFSPPLDIPDAGTVFEMGYLFGKHPIYGFTLRPQGEKVNLMLTQSLEGVIYGFDELAKFFNRGRIRPQHAVKGVWKHR